MKVCVCVSHIAVCSILFLPQPIRFLEEVLQEVKAFMWDCRRKHTFKAMLVVGK